MHFALQTGEKSRAISLLTVNNMLHGQFCGKREYSLASVNIHMILLQKVNNQI